MVGLPGAWQLVASPLYDPVQSACATAEQAVPLQQAPVQGVGEHTVPIWVVPVPQAVVWKLHTKVVLLQQAKV